MKFIVFGDPHYTESSPLMRKDNYGDLILDKLKWIIDFADNESATMLCVGDWFHRKHNTSIREINKLMDAIGNKTIYTVLGNHDVQFHQSHINLDTLPVGVLVKAGKIRLIENDEEVDFLNGVYVTGESYHLGYEIPRTYSRSVKEALCHIHLTHGMLTEKPLPFDAVCIDDLELSCDFLFNGHNHKFFKDEERGIYNVGSVARIAMDKNSLNKKPTVCLLDTDTKKVEQYEIPIEKDVWIGEVKRDTLNSEEVEAFAKSIQEMELSDDEEILKEILKDESEEVEIKTYSYLGE